MFAALELLFFCFSSPGSGGNARLFIWRRFAVRANPFANEDLFEGPTCKTSLVDRKWN
jgi:hypothetical protein